MSLRKSVFVLVPLAMMLGLTAHVAAVPAANQHFERTWERTDQPVKNGQVARTWMWGPEAFTAEMLEQYAESPGTVRQVQYYDKSRMEINNPDQPVVYPWFVTNGLLVVEMITGQMQVGDNAFIERTAAEVPVAGDLDDPDGPTYETFASLLDESPIPAGTTYTTRLDRNGTITVDASLASHNVMADFLDTVTNHRVAAPFWQFMNSSGLVVEDGQLINDTLFEDPFFATGRPITEAHWITSRVAGTPRDVLAQCFERRCMTYTPGNPEGFIVEAGNVGLHYFQWRYGEVGSPEEGAIIAQTNFSDWSEVANPVGGHGAPTANSYIITTPPLTFLQVVATNEFGDASVSVDIRILAPTSSGLACLLVRADPVDQLPHFLDEGYNLCLVSDETRITGVQLAYILGNEPTVLGDWSLDLSAVDSAWHTVKLITRGTHLWALIDDDVVGSAIHDGPNQGTIGISAVNSTVSGTIAEFEFTNLVIRSLLAE